MAGSVNRVLLIGRLGRDPEVRTFQNGGKVCNLSLATSETWRDKSTGERKENTQWHRVAIFNEKLAEIAEKYLKKGAQIYIEGQLETRKWKDKDGVDRYSTEVTLRNFRGTLTMLNTRVDGQRSDDDEDDPPPEDAQTGGRPGNYGRGSGKGIEDEDIPF